jgi:peptidoglycan/LPS O-acetylase OafA/YrhL
VQAYRPDIDGLRAVAVLLVVVFHAFPPALPAGYLGVDVFFVISGFLITRIIAAEMEAGTFTVRGFYARRVRRIFPALVLVLLATLAIGWLVLASAEYAALGRHVVGGATFSSNFVLWRDTGYFQPEAEATPLLHLWSLAVEEQFYLVWPLVLLFTGRRLGAVVAVAAASFAATLLVKDASAAFYLPATRMWELAVGGALAMARPRQIRGASLLGLVLLAIPVAASGERFDAFTLLAVAGSALLIHAGPQGAVNRLLSHRWLVAVGLISYPLYLWHWPLLSFLSMADAKVGVEVRLAAVAASFALAIATYRWLERPARRGGRPAVMLLVAAMTATATAGALAWSNVAPPRASLSGVDAFMAEMTAWGFPGDARLTTVGGLEVRTVGREDAPATLFLGDSFAQQYLPRVQAAMPSGRRAVFVTQPSCSVIPGVIRKTHRIDCVDFAARAVDFALGAQHVDVIVVAAYLYGDMWSGAEAVQAFDRLLERLASKEARVFVVMPQPAGRPFAMRSIVRRTILGPEIVPRAVKLDEIDRPYREQLVAAARKHQAQVIEPADSVCAEVCEVVVDGRPVYFADGMHFSVQFVRERAGFIDQVLR